MKNQETGEPFPPEKTPTPPQVMDPSVYHQQDEKWRKPAGSDKKNEAVDENRQPKKEQAKPKRSGESETEIDDETTI